MADRYEEMARSLLTRLAGTPNVMTHGEAILAAALREAAAGALVEAADTIYEELANQADQAWRFALRVLKRADAIRKGGA